MTPKEHPLIKTYLLPWEPIPWKRCGANFNRKVIYDQQKQEKLVTGIELIKQHEDERMFYGPLRIRFIFSIPLRADHCRRVTHKRPSPIEGKYYHFFKPDIDNYVKYILDAMKQTGVIFQDDGQIAELYAIKVFSAHPQTEITIGEIYERTIQT